MDKRREQYYLGPEPASRVGPGEAIISMSISWRGDLPVKRIFFQRKGDSRVLKRKPFFPPFDPRDQNEIVIRYVMELVIVIDEELPVDMHLGEDYEVSIRCLSVSGGSLFVIFSASFAGSYAVYKGISEYPKFCEGVRKCKEHAIWATRKTFEGVDSLDVRATWLRSRRQRADALKRLGSQAYHHLKRLREDKPKRVRYQKPKTSPPYSPEDGVS